MRFCAQQHTSHKIGCADARGTLDNLEATGFLDGTIAVFAIGIRGDVVAVNDVFAAVVGDPGERSYVRRMGD